MTLITFWLFVGSFALVLLTIQDVFNKMVVDERRNYFLQGVTFALLGVYTKSLLWLLGVLAISIIVLVGYGYATKKGWIGSADVSALTWITTGLMVYNPVAVAFFYAALIMSSIVGYSVKATFKYKSALPYLPNILTAWILTLLLIRGVV